MPHPSYFAIVQSGILPDAGRNWQGMNWIGRTRRYAIYLRDRWTCAYCFTDLRDAPPGVRTLDHLDPRVYGGDNSSRNLVTACLTCNDRRQDRPWREFASVEAIRFIRNARRRKVNLKAARAWLREHRIYK